MKQRRVGLAICVGLVLLAWLLWPTNGDSASDGLVTGVLPPSSDWLPIRGARKRADDRESVSEGQEAGPPLESLEPAGAVIYCPLESAVKKGTLVRLEEALWLPGGSEPFRFDVPAHIEDGYLVIDSAHSAGRGELHFLNGPYRPTKMSWDPDEPCPTVAVDGLAPVVGTVANTMVGDWSPVWVSGCGRKVRVGPEGSYYLPCEPGRAVIVA